MSSVSSSEPQYIAAAKTLNEASVKQWNGCQRDVEWSIICCDGQLAEFHRHGCHKDEDEDHEDVGSSPSCRSFHYCAKLKSVVTRRPVDIIVSWLHPDTESSDLLNRVKDVLGED